MSTSGVVALGVAIVVSVGAVIPAYVSGHFKKVCSLTSSPCRRNSAVARIYTMRKGNVDDSDRVNVGAAQYRKRRVAMHSLQSGSRPVQCC